MIYGEALSETKKPLTMNLLSERLAEYILDSEYHDFLEFCMEAGLNPSVISKKNIDHIYAQSVAYLINSGFDVEGHSLEIEVLE